MRGQPVHRFPTQSQLAAGLRAHALAGNLQLIARHDPERASAYGAERRHVGEGIVDVQQQETADPGRLLPTLDQLLDECLRGQLVAFVLNPLHVLAQRIDEAVSKLPVALPCETQQLQVCLLRVHAPQVIDGVKVRQARVLVQSKASIRRSPASCAGPARTGCAIRTLPMRSSAGWT